MSERKECRECKYFTEITERCYVNHYYTAHPDAKRVVNGSCCINGPPCSADSHPVAFTDTCGKHSAYEKCDCQEEREVTVNLRVKDGLSMLDIVRDENNRVAQGHVMKFGIDSDLGSDHENA
ncbi:MAG: hypothetical protein GY854_19790 [Deltaproteobacteria bacterium]|nr:hypothetical protein [Deltaproteobacteria bacterium]